ncbi:MAG: 16S rRNA (adenine(1518)-N(6)/adenine(1519)-N(6))-dimethyltransferase RsmA [Candidatus Omnitrophota bacterium]
MQRKIIAACNFLPTDTVLEIGSGRGEMTGLIAERVNSVYALEIDRELLPELRETLKNFSNIKIFNQDILKFDLQNCLKSVKSDIKAFGNIPYYITTPIIEYLLENRGRVDVIFLTVQKEFAKRLVSPEGSADYSSWSCFVQYFTSPKIVFKIKKTCFSPIPKVDSCLMRLDVRPIPAVKVRDEGWFFKVIRSAFNQRRKTLRNSLKRLASQDKLRDFFSEYSINPKIRPEDLSLQNFAYLADFIR